MAIALGLRIMAVALVLYLFYRRSSIKKQDVLAHDQFVASLNGKNFLCYNNKDGLKEVVETLLIPKLASAIEIIYLDGRDPISSYDRKFISKALYQLKDYSKFPHLIKFRNGEIFDKSINNEFYNLVNQSQPFDKLVIEINDFFELG